MLRKSCLRTIFLLLLYVPALFIYSYKAEPRLSPILTDSYKVTHWNLYPEKIRAEGGYYQFNLSARKSWQSEKFVYVVDKTRNIRQLPISLTYDHVFFYGLQQQLMKYFSDIVVTMEDVEKAREFAQAHFNCSPETVHNIFHYEGWKRIVEKHGGLLPLRIKAMPEGSLVNIPKSGGNVLLVIENTDPEFYWLPGYAETLIVQLWYPITIATNSNHLNVIIKKYLLATGVKAENVPYTLPFKLHDFGFRGVSSTESAGIGGAAHLTAFKGTDTQQALLHAHTFYQARLNELGFSIPATEHSVMTSYIQMKAPNTIEKDSIDGAENSLSLEQTSVVDPIASNLNAIDNILNYVERTRPKMIAMVIDSYGPSKFYCQCS